MTAQESPRTADGTSVLGTLGWVGVVLLCAIAALVLLSALGPAGGQ